MTNSVEPSDDHLLSASHADMAHHLRAMFIAKVAQENADMPRVIAALQAFDGMLTKPSDESKNAFHAARQQIDDPKERSRFTSHVARIGQINEMAGLVARDNRFLEYQNEGISVPGGVEALIKNDNMKSVEQALSILAKPTFAITFTGHPTNVVSLSAIRAQRELLRAIDGKRTKKEGADAKLADAMKQFVNEPVLNLDDKRTPKRLA